MSTPQAPWDIYAQQLGYLGYGHPLWVPDPAPGSAPVEIGDVGWINRGEFQPLFNVFKGKDEGQPRGGVPIDHVPLDMRDCIVSGPRDEISQSMLCSTSIRRVNISGEMSGALPLPNISCDVNFNFVCTDEAGALLLLGPSGRTQEILSHKLICDYIGVHFDRWMEFANHRLRIGLREDQIIFVSGTTKTSRWGVAAFKDTSREKRGAVVGSLGSLATIDFSVSVSDTQLSPTHYRTGPMERLPNSCTPASLQDQYDQCVFIHYYKRKRRRLPLFPSVMKAAAGPHELPRHPDDGDDHQSCATDPPFDSDDSSNEDFARFPKQIPVKQAGDHVLDYILENSSAAVAIASDTDLLTLNSRQSQDLEGLVFPRDITQYLATTKPSILLNGELGSLSDISKAEGPEGVTTSLGSIVSSNAGSPATSSSSVPSSFIAWLGNERSGLPDPRDSVDPELDPVSRTQPALNSLGAMTADPPERRRSHGYLESKACLNCYNSKIKCKYDTESRNVCSNCIARQRECIPRNGKAPDMHRGDPRNLRRVSRPSPSGDNVAGGSHAPPAPGTSLECHSVIGGKSVEFRVRGRLFGV